MERAIRELSAVAEDAAERDEWIDETTLLLAMELAMTWDVSLDSDGRLVLPETPRKLGIVPGAGQTVAIFVYGEIVQIWRPDDFTSVLDRRGTEIVTALGSLAE